MLKKMFVNQARMWRKHRESQREIEADMAEEEETEEVETRVGTSAKRGPHHLRGRYFHGELYAAKARKPVPAWEELDEQVAKHLKKRRPEEVHLLKIKLFKTAVLCKTVDNRDLKLCIRATSDFHEKAVFDDILFNANDEDDNSPKLVGKVICLLQLPNTEEVAFVRIYKGEQMWQDPWPFHAVLGRRFRLLKLTERYMIVPVHRIVSRIFLWPIVPRVEAFAHEDLFWHIDWYEKGLSARGSEVTSTLL